MACPSNDVLQSGMAWTIGCHAQVKAHVVLDLHQQMVCALYNGKGKDGWSMHPSISADIGSGRSAHLHVEIGVVQMWVV
eukprot:scaffold584_cov338-Pavlova_lutheri.AAC.4